MLLRVFRKIYDHLCQKILDTNPNLIGKGFMEINPKYFDEMLVQANMVDYWIGQLEAHIAQARVKEQMYQEGIARCNYLIQEVLPLIGTAMALLKQSVDYNTRINNELDAGDTMKRVERPIPVDCEIEFSHLSPDEKLHFQNITLMLSDTFERLGEKRNKIKQWVSQARLESRAISEA